METLRDLLAATAWEMEIPPAYGAFHILFMVIGFSVSVFAAWKLRHLTDRQNRILLFSIGVFLVVCEVYKQLMYEVVLEPEPGYRWGNFSFQLCSIPMYLCIIVPCLKEGTVRQAMYTFMMTYNLVGGFIAFFEPSGLFHGHWTLTFHALIWHMILVFVGVYIGFSGRGGQDLYRYKYAMRLFFVLCMIAYGFNLIFWEVSAHEVGVFFLGPKDPSIIVFKQIAETFGWVVSNVLYILSLCLGAYLVFILFRLACKRMDMKVEPSNPKQKKEPAEML